VEAVERQVRAVEQVVLAAERQRAQKQPLEQPPVDEAARLGVRKRLMRGQPLAEAVTDEAAQVEPQRRHPQQLPDRADPLERGRDHQLHQHDRIDRRTPDILGVIGRRRRAHERPIDQLVETAVAVVGRHQLVQADQLDLQRRRPILDSADRHPKPPAFRVLSRLRIPVRPDGRSPLGAAFWTSP
jgi:hypothetical protein